MTVRLRVSFDIEMDEENPELLEFIQRHTERMTEHLEAHWSKSLEDAKKKYPDLKMNFGTGDDEGEDWK